MPQLVYLIIGIVAAYLLGAMPSGYLAARWTAGIDLRKHGTGGIGLSNVWHTVPARWIIIPVILFDICKVMPAVWLANAVGLDLWAQVVIGFAGIIGHNWPIYLRFHGGRGMLSTIGFTFIVPVVNGMVPWPLIAGLAVVLVMMVILRSSGLAVWLAIATPQVVGLILGDPLPLLLGYVGIFVMMVFRRLVQPRSPLSVGMTWRQVLFYRFFLDRDIRDRKKWVKR